MAREWTLNGFPEGGGQQRRPDTAKALANGLSGVKALIVDDDRASAKLLRVVLESEGCVTRVASSAEEALAILKSFTPRVIIVDVILPLMSGLLLAQQVKDNAALRDVVIVAVSAFNGPSAARAARRAGCAEYVRKPIDPLTFGKLLLVHLHLGGAR